MNIPHLKIKNKNIRRITKVSLAIFLSLGIIFTALGLLFFGRIFPNIYIGNIGVGTQKAARVPLFLSQKVKVPEKITLIYDNQIFDIPTKEINLSYNFVSSAERAYELAHSGNLIADWYKSIRLIFGERQNIGLDVKLNNDLLDKHLQGIFAQISQDPVPPSINIKKDQVEIYPGAQGYKYDQEEIRGQIGYNLSFLIDDPIILTRIPYGKSLSESEIARTKNRVGNLLSKKIELAFESGIYIPDASQMIAFIDPTAEYNSTTISDYADSLAKIIDRKPQEPVFIVENGKVLEFTTSKNGVSVNTQTLVSQITGNLRLLENSSDMTVKVGIPVTITFPEVTTENVNNLGIKELIGKGSSKYAHSIPNRIFNVALAASKFKGVLVKPGETFSFNQILGDISPQTGYKQAYIIKEGRTILGDGGGVCQVSSTLFRALLNAGLPIIERAAHAYRVGYYEQGSPPGFDATVYAPSPDLKFINDTPGYILIQPFVDTQKTSLDFELYGTYDGRVATVTKPIITNSTPPPPDLYQDDPTLKTGVVKQVDYAAWGANVTFNYTVTRTGETIFQKTFVSNYRPWQAVFLRGTGQ